MTGHVISITNPLGQFDNKLKEGLVPGAATPLLLLPFNLFDDHPIHYKALMKDMAFF